MGLQRIILIVLLASQLSLIFAINYLPKLRNNKLSEGVARDLPNATELNCGGVCITEATIRRKLSISEALTTENFATYAFTAGPVAAPGARPIEGNIGKFSFVEVKGTRHKQYVLQVDEHGDKAYWLPQGGTIDIPMQPRRGEPRYVFTPDFSGCSWTATPLDNGNLRIRHVEGGMEATQFNTLRRADIGGDKTYAMEYKEYGYVVETRRLVGNVPAFAYLRYLPGGGVGNWLLKFQRKTCSDVAGGFSFNNYELARVMLVETSSYFPQVHSAKSLLIPNEITG